MVTGVAAGAVFHIPVWRHVMHWIGCAPATAATFRSLLKKSSAGVVPGGIAEMYLIDSEKEVYKLRDRKGFVRIAVETGWPVIPVIHLGQSQLLRWGPAWLQPIARRVRISLGFIFGIGNLPLPIPSRKPLMMVVGGAIPVRHLQRGAQGFDAEVDRVLGLVIDSCESMYARYAPLYGWGHRPLEIA
jgi:2-acylglycerol O-acyltransferase 2